VRSIRILLAAGALAMARAALASCSISTSPVVFGAYDPLAGGPLDTIAEITIACPAGVPFQVSLDAGQGSAGTSRAMGSDGTGPPLRYDLYRDPAHSDRWGDGIGGTSVQRGAGSGGPVVLQVYGRIPPRQKVTAGMYRDVVFVTVEW
jgi:spore coat protein U-like protein